MRGAQVTGPGKARVVEVEPSGARWIKSSASGGNGDTGCVEVASVDNVILVRNSRNRGSRLTFPVPSWIAFLSR